MKPEYVVKKSVPAVLSFWKILFFFLIVPLVIQIVMILQARAYAVEFYADKVIIKSGIINKSERQMAFAGVRSVSVSQSLFGRMFNYGNVYIDCVGPWDVNTEKIIDPKGLKSYLESKISTQNVQEVYRSI